MLKNKNIRFYSSEIANNQAIDDLYINAVVSKKKELQVELEEKIKKIQQPIQQDTQQLDEDTQQLNEDIQQLNKRIRDYNSILEQLRTPKKNEKVFFQSDKVKNRKEKSMLDKSNPINIEHNEKNEEEKFSNPTGVEVQLEQKNTDNIAALEQTQNSQDNSSFKLQQDIKKQENQVKPLPTPSGLGVTGELAKKIAKRRALLDGQDNINTGNVSYSKEAEQSLKVKSINQKNIQNQHSQTFKQALNSVNSVPINHSLNVTEELARILAERNKISERNNNDTTEKEKVISSTTNVSLDEQSKLSERAAVEVQLEQKNTDKIVASEQTQNSQDNFSLLQNLQIAIENLKKREATEQTNNLPIWVEIDFLLERLAYSTNEKKDEDLEFRLDEKISHQFNDQSDEEFIKQAASIKNSFFYNKIVPILKTLKRHLPPEKFDLLSNEILVKNSEKQLDKKTFQELDLQANSFDRCLSIILEKNINIDGASSDQSHSDASYTINGNKGSKNISAEFDKIEMQLQEIVQQLEATVQKPHEDQASNILNDKKVKFSKNKIPTTVYFKTLSPIDNTDPVVLSATLKS